MKGTAVPGAVDAGGQGNDGSRQGTLDSCEGPQTHASVKRRAKQAENSVNNVFSVVQQSGARNGSRLSVWEDQEAHRPKKGRLLCVGSGERQG